MSKQQTVSVSVTAISTGYYKGRIIRAGEKFTFEGALNHGRLPLWVKGPKNFKGAKTTSKASKSKVKEASEQEVEDLI